MLRTRPRRDGVTSAAAAATRSIQPWPVRGDRPSHLAGQPAGEVGQRVVVRFEGGLLSFPADRHQVALEEQEIGPRPTRPAWSSILCEGAGLRGGAGGDKEIFRGTLYRAAVEPREILKECLVRKAGGFVLFHTHPSSDPTPSPEDLQFTRRMAQAAVIIGVELVDHLVLGATGRWVSLQARGGW